jgi:DNA polymerase-4
MVEPSREAKGISCETTFESDIADGAALEARLWPLAETLARRLRAADSHAASVVLKLKTARFRLLTRRRTLARPTQLATELFQAGRALLAPETGIERYRLIGIGAGELVPAAAAAATGDLFDQGFRRDAKLEQAVEEIRARFGDAAIATGRGLRGKPR